MGKDEILKLINDFKIKKEPNSEISSETKRFLKLKDILDMVNGNSLTQAKMGLRKIGSDNNWQPRIFGEYEITRPTIICVPGSGAVSDRDANAFCKRAENLIGLKVGKGDYASYDYVDLLGFSYAVVNRFSTNFAPDETTKVALDMLLPLCLDKAGKPLSLDLAKKNLSMVTFLSHCHGAVEVHKIMKTLKDELINECGYSHKDVKELFDSVRHISYAPNTTADIVPSIRTFSFEDFLTMT